MNGIVVITPPDASPGFACCGATQRVAFASEAEETLLLVLNDMAGGMVILDERLLVEMGEERLREIERGWPGVVVVLPAPSGSAGEEDYALRLIRRAIGYHVRVRT
jgi:V/A-type H+-transporting ATPase subunit F